MIFVTIFIEYVHSTDVPSVEKKDSINLLKMGRAMAQAVSRRPLTAEARVRSHADPSGRAV